MISGTGVSYSLESQIKKNEKRGKRGHEKRGQIVTFLQNVPKLPRPFNSRASIHAVHV